MDNFDKLDKKLEEDSNEYKSILDNTSNLVKVIPYIQQLKDETDTKRAIINSLPRERVEAKATEFLSFEEESDKAIKPFLPFVPPVNPLFVKTVESTAGSSTGYILFATDSMQNYSDNAESDNEWIPVIQEVVDEHTLKIQQKKYLPDRLNKLNRDLGLAFNVVQDSYAKCQNNIAGIDTTAMQMRDIIQQVWGGGIKSSQRKGYKSQK